MSITETIIPKIDGGILHKTGEESDGDGPLSEAQITETTERRYRLCNYVLINGTLAYRDSFPFQQTSTEYTRTSNFLHNLYLTTAQAETPWILTSEAVHDYEALMLKRIGNNTLSQPSTGTKVDDQANPWWRFVEFWRVLNVYRTLTETHSKDAKPITKFLDNQGTDALAKALYPDTLRKLLVQNETKVSGNDWVGRKPLEPSSNPKPFTGVQVAYAQTDTKNDFNYYQEHPIGPMSVEGAFLLASQVAGIDWKKVSDRWASATSKKIRESWWIGGFLQQAGGPIDEYFQDGTFRTAGRVNGNNFVATGNPDGGFYFAIDLDPDLTDTTKKNVFIFSFHSVDPESRVSFINTTNQMTLLYKSYDPAGNPNPATITSKKRTIFFSHGHAAVMKWTDWKNFLGESFSFMAYVSSENEKNAWPRYTDFMRGDGKPRTVANTATELASDGRPPELASSDYRGVFGTPSSRESLASIETIDQLLTVAVLYTFHCSFVDATNPPLRASDKGIYKAAFSATSRADQSTMRGHRRSGAFAYTPSLPSVRSRAEGTFTPRPYSPSVTFQAEYGSYHRGRPTGPAYIRYTTQSTYGGREGSSSPPPNPRRRHSPSRAPSRSPSPHYEPSLKPWARYVDDNYGDEWTRLADALHEYDDAFIEDCKDDIDTLLVFAGLFSAVLTAFNIESYKNLEQDSGDVSAAALVHISEQLSSFLINSQTANSSLSSFSLPDFKPPASAVRINALWFTSLVLSLISASLGMLVKQWLREYLKGRYSSPQERIRVRHYRWEGLYRWRVFEIAAALPILLQIALILFFIGLRKGSGKDLPPYALFPGDERGVRRDSHLDIPAMIAADKQSGDDDFMERTLRPCLLDMRGEGVVRFVRAALSHRLDKHVRSLEDIQGRDLDRLTTKALFTSMNMALDALNPVLDLENMGLYPWMHELLDFLFNALNRAHYKNWPIGETMNNGLHLQWKLLNQNEILAKECLRLLANYPYVRCVLGSRLDRVVIRNIISVSRDLLTIENIDASHLCRVILSIAILQPDTQNIFAQRASFHSLLAAIAHQIEQGSPYGYSIQTLTFCLQLCERLEERAHEYVPAYLAHILNVLVNRPAHEGEFILPPQLRPVVQKPAMKTLSRVANEVDLSAVWKPSPPDRSSSSYVPILHIPPSATALETITEHDTGDGNPPSSDILRITEVTLRGETDTFLQVHFTRSSVNSSEIHWISVEVKMLRDAGTSRVIKVHRRFVEKPDFGLSLLSPFTPMSLTESIVPNVDRVARHDTGADGADGKPSSEAHITETLERQYRLRNYVLVNGNPVLRDSFPFDKTSIEYTRTSKFLQNLYQETAQAETPWILTNEALTEYKDLMLKRIGNKTLSQPANDKDKVSVDDWANPWWRFVEFWRVLNVYRTLTETHSNDAKPISSFLDNQLKDTEDKLAKALYPDTLRQLLVLNESKVSGNDWVGRKPLESGSNPKPFTGVQVAYAQINAKNDAKNDFNYYQEHPIGPMSVEGAFLLASQVAGIDWKKVSDRWASATNKIRESWWIGGFLEQAGGPIYEYFQDGTPRMAGRVKDKNFVATGNADGGFYFAADLDPDFTDTTKKNVFIFAFHSVDVQSRVTFINNTNQMALLYKSYDPTTIPEIQAITSKDKKTIFFSHGHSAIMSQTDWNTFLDGKYKPPGGTTNPIPPYKEVGQMHFYVSSENEKDAWPRYTDFLRGDGKPKTAASTVADPASDGVDEVANSLGSSAHQECGGQSFLRVCRPSFAAAPSAGGPDSVEMDGGYLVHRIVPDDNSCLFSSIALIFEQDISKAQNIRKIVADEIRQDALTWTDAILGQPREGYIATILKPSSWGGAIELSILAKHYATEIDSIDVETGRIDHFTPPSGDATENRCVLVYSGIHYDATSIAPILDAPPDFHQTLLRREKQDDTDPVLVAAKKLADKLRAKRAYTNTATFDLRCQVCRKGLKGEKEARAHAKETGHVEFGEY
ncbi:hypothetical protein NM688_g2021 [Phlebia brevispora]|uniref:Uncharacterized protein n=1 Tax=Phlebia brevispora TaxID=194682 RepID=A0ACC1TA42_9APHY|nr:hypothetical protein NM688_g2021 [Phlebia brevispora]